MPFDFITTYFPSPDEITPAELASARARLLTWQQPAAPDLDMRPGSTFGTWMLDPYARFVAAVEIALARARSDFDVGGVAQGIVFDCDYVENYLKGLGGRRQESTSTVGYVRLEFNSNLDVDIPGGLRVLFNDQDVFLPLTYPAGPLRVRKVGTIATDNTMLPLRPIGPSQYAVVVAVTGFAAEVLAGASAQWDQTIQGLTSIVAVSNFVAGRSNNSVPAIAQRTLETFNASGFLTRAGILKELKDVMPDLVGVTTALAGDREMLRTGHSALGVSDGVVDVLVRSSCRAVYEQTIYVQYVADQESVQVGKFLAAWTPLAQPTRLLNIQWTGDTSIPLTYRCFARSADPARAPLLTCAYSNLEQLELAIEMPLNADNTPVIDLDQLPTGNFAWFKITYEADASVEAVQKYAGNEAAAGLDVLVKAPLQLLITKLVFSYTRTAGVLFNSEQAQQDITNYITQLMSPRKLSSADLQDRIYSAGADRILKTEVQARLLLSVADYIVPENVATILTNYAAVVAAARAVPSITLYDINALNPQYLDPLIGEGGETLGAAGSRNIAYTLNSGALSFNHDETA